MLSLASHVFCSEEADNLQKFNSIREERQSTPPATTLRLTLLHSAVETERNRV